MSNEKNYRIQQKSADTKLAAAHQLRKNESAAFLSDNRSHAVTQLKTEIKNTGQTYNYGHGHNQMVGKKMEAWLDPAKPIRGQSANLNTSQDDMMGTIRHHYGIKGGGVVKGHLLNDNLGGTALSNNLYPITKGANSAHLGYVENVAKDQLWNEDNGIYYKVEVDGSPKLNKPLATFSCQMNHWNPKTKKLGASILNRDVNSNLESVGEYHDVEDMDTDDFEREKNPRKPAAFTNPATTVGHLSSEEERWRNKDNDKTLPRDFTWQRG